MISYISAATSTGALFSKRVNTLFIKSGQHLQPDSFKKPLFSFSGTFSFLAVCREGSGEVLFFLSQKRWFSLSAMGVAAL